MFLLKQRLNTGCTHTSQAMRCRTCLFLTSLGTFAVGSLLALLCRRRSTAGAPAHRCAQAETGVGLTPPRRTTLRLAQITPLGQAPGALTTLLYFHFDSTAILQPFCSEMWCLARWHGLRLLPASALPHILHRAMGRRDLKGSCPAKAWQMLANPSFHTTSLHGQSLLTPTSERGSCL